MATLQQPYRYPLRRPFAEPDWSRLPGYRAVNRREWEDARWQRAHSVRTLAELRQAFGTFLADDLLEDIAADQRLRATMSMLIPPHMINTMNERDLRRDPVRRYMIPALSERDPVFPSHPMAMRDPLREAAMWAVEGLTHRYPTKVLAELVQSCPHYCGHCTRMDLVGNDTPQVKKRHFKTAAPARAQAMIEYLRSAPQIRDVVVSGGDLANVPIARLEAFVMSLLKIEHIRDIRLASKAVMGLPQHFLQDEVKGPLERIGKAAHRLGVDLSVQTHVNAAQQVTPLVARAVRLFLDAGFRDVRNQGVLLRDINTTPHDILELSFMLLDHAKITPYYLYLCDVTPNTEHWRLAVWEGQELQRAIIGYLPGFATPRVVCDVPLAGKRWIDQPTSYDRVRGISYWTKNFWTPIESSEASTPPMSYEYYDPLYTLPPEGQEHWSHLPDRVSG